MDTVQSFKGYGKVDDLEETAFKKSLHRRLIILSITLVVLVSLIAGIVTGVLVHRKNSGDSPAKSNSVIQTVCSVTPFPESCFASLSSSKLSDPQKLFQYSLTVAINALEKVSNLPEDYAKKTNDPLVQEAGRVCTEVLNDAVDSLNDTVSSDGSPSASKISDLRTWLSTVVTDMETCFDTLEEANATFVGEIRSLLGKSSELASNSLAIVSKLLGLLQDFKIPFGGRRRLMESGDFPAWISAGDRRILQDTAVLMPNLTVSKTGKLKSVNAAVKLIPLKSLTKFVILVKKGTYVENVVLDKKHWNVVFLGEGIDVTVISGGLNFIDGTPTFKTATVAVAGRAFMAKGITFINTAGPEKHQAVALRSGSDLSIFYQCKFDAYQDTLYAHSNRQFYRDCDITGTIDFIFGNAAVVFQTCNILPRQPMANQFNTITAQGKKESNQNTGISIQGCDIRALDNVTAKTYLGRPWKEYSTTVIMQSSISAVLDGKGWISWVMGVEPVKTIMYGEYLNTGAGANLNSRVKWKGYSPRLKQTQASKFMVETFINGPTWFKGTGVTYQLNG